MLEPEEEKFKSINNEAQGKKSKTDKQTDTGCFPNNDALSCLQSAGEPQETARLEVP